MTTISTKNLVAAFILLLSAISSYAQMTHPGGWLTSTDLSRIRQGVASGQEPWASAWDDVRNKRTGRADVSSTITDRGALQSQGEDAFILAVKWIATGDQIHATQGINILNAWVRNVDRIDVDDATLRTGIGSNMMANAAEIFAHGFNGNAGWSRRDVRAAQDWFRNVVYPITTNGRQRSMNWGTACVAGNMSMAIFCDDRTMFNDAVDAYKFGFTNTNDGCAGVTQYIVNAAGQCFESERDQGHTQGGIAHLVEPAMIAWNQGVDLVSYSGDRLVAGMEYTARYNLGNSVPFVDNVSNPCNLRFGWMNNGFISSDDRGDFSPVYVMAKTLFDYANKSNRFTSEVASLSSYFPENGNSDHPGMGHLLYSGAADNSRPINPTPTNGTLVNITKRNSRGFAIDGNKGGVNGQNVYLWKENQNNVNQQWIEIDRGNGFYSYQKQGTNFCIDGGNRGSQNQNLYLWTCSNNNQNQHWQKVRAGGGAYKLIKRNARGFAINGGSGGKNGQNVDLWNSASTNQNLQWFITPLGTSAKSIGSSVDDGLVNDIFTYPNPVESTTTVVNAANSTFTIYAMDSSMLFTQTISSDSEIIDLSELASGIYFAEVKGATSLEVIKLVKN